MVWTEWGISQTYKKPAVVCVHGLTRCGRDFDWLASYLSDTHRVICPDVLGRGESDWLDDPQGYTYTGYLSDMTTLVAALGVQDLAWVGTSMGGLIGLFLAALPHTPIRALVLNDIGPFISSTSLEPLVQYVRCSGPFTSFSQAHHILSQRYAEFGPMSAEQKEHLIRMSLRSVVGEPDIWHMHYDPKIADVFLEACTQNIDLWSVWDAVCIPVLVLRGQNSDLLSRETCERMSYKENVTVHEIPECGHAPSLMPEEQIQIVRRWLEKHFLHEALGSPRRVKS